MEAEEFLAKAALFRHLGKDALEHLSRQMEFLSFPEEPLVREGDPPDGFYIVKSGVAKVTKPSGPGGAEVVLALLRRGDSFGELALIDGLSRSATVTAMRAMECYLPPGMPLWWLWNDIPR